MMLCLFFTDIRCGLRWRSLTFNYLKAFVIALLLLDGVV